MGFYGFLIRMGWIDLRENHISRAGSEENNLLRS